MARLSSVEICAGGGGLALGLELAGFDHEALVEINDKACATLHLNRPSWNVLQMDIREFSGAPFRGVDLLAGGVPCTPFSRAGERDLFPEALRLVEEIRPKAVILENVPGFASSRFADYRKSVRERLRALGYRTGERILKACDFGVPQLRPCFILIALRGEWADRFQWPRRCGPALTVGQALEDLMASRGWPGAAAWAMRANTIAPTLSGGADKHGEPVLGPPHTLMQWAKLGVDGRRIADEAPDRYFPLHSMPRLTIRMVARLQGFPDAWRFTGGKTAAFRQIGNALPPPVAAAVGRAVLEALTSERAAAPAVEGLSELPLVELMERAVG